MLSEHKKRVGIMTGGGDCPGLNAAIRAVAKTAIKAGYEVLGFKSGWQGLLNEDNYFFLDRLNTSGIIDKGGTILGTSRISPFSFDDGPERVLNNFNKLGLEALVVLGGDGTLSATARMSQMGLPIVGIPKTIDNDVIGTEYTIGFQTAVQVATDALDRLRSTAESHHRVMLLEVMGRNSGWIATYAGIANGADAILIPEIPLDNSQIDALCKMICSRNSRGINFSVVVVAEGVLLPDLDLKRDDRHLGGVGSIIADIIIEKTGLDAKYSALGYVQRGGTPVAYDRSLATHFGVKAIELVQKKKYGRMVVLYHNQIKDIPIEKAAEGIRTVDLKIYKVASRFFG